MKLTCLLAVFAILSCSTTSVTAINDTMRSEDKPAISENDLNALIDSQFPGSETQSATTPQTVEESSGRTPEGGPTRVPQTGNDQSSGDCECVLYYQCSTNRTIIENGENIIDPRMDSGSGPCADYMQVCCKLAETLAPEDAITPTPPVVSASNTCGQRNVQGVSTLRIMATEENEAQFGEFPWVVAITMKTTNPPHSEFQCGGSLINPQVVLTAAHCVEGKINLSIRAGEWDTQRKTEPLPSQTRKVKQIVVHEEYKAGILHNDIALLLLDIPVELAANVATICLPEQGESMDNRNCVASGWGKNNFEKKGGYQEILKKIDLPIVERGKCLEALQKTRLGRHFKLHESFICAGGIRGKDTCKGDGGGPLACPTPNNPNIYVQAGIIAWGIGCGTETPGVYVNVASFRNWIDNKSSTFIDARNISS